MSTQPDLKHTSLYDLHLELGARMVPFAGYEMPVQYPLGVLKEHLHTRGKAGLFDVSHMGQGILRPKAGFDAALALEKLVPGDIRGLRPGGQRYTMLLNQAGGVLDDLMVTRTEGDDGSLFLVVNAACKDQDFLHIEARIGSETTLEKLDQRALLALQGPAAADVLQKFFPAVGDMGFMTAAQAELDGQAVFISRSGYTGEDGFEISIPSNIAADFARGLVALEEVEPIGLGARDSLRLEAGLCLYGHDLDETTSPIEAGLAWTVGKSRRMAGDFPGAGRILSELADGPERRRVGIQPDGRAPAREGAEIVDEKGKKIGLVTSGGFGPSVEGPIAMGFVSAGFASAGTALGLVVRGKVLPARVVPMPFVPHRYFRKAK